MTMRRFSAAAAALMVATPAGAQIFDGARVQTGPQYVQYRIGGTVGETISELAIPVFAIVPIGSRFSVDVGTSYAQSRVRFTGGESRVSGMTDTQLRANYSLGNDFIVLTAGVNLPTGETTVTLDQLLAASRIANDFLSFPISSMGAGTAVTGGVAIARPLGTWNVGAGGSVRFASAFEPLEPEAGPAPRYQPGNEYKLRLGADRPVGAGQFALGLTFSTFGEDDFGGSLYNTGDRYVGQVGYARPVSFGTFNIGAWNLYRSAGQLIGGVEIPWDNIVNASTSLSINTRGPLIEPSVQVRSWFQRVSATDSDAARTDRSSLAELGLRARVGAGPLTLFPGVGYAFGTLNSGADATARLTGFRGALGVQIR